MSQRGCRKDATGRVYAVRDRDFLRADLLGKDHVLGVYPLERHCIESYVLEPTVLEAALQWKGAEEKLLSLAERQFWRDLGRAVLDACAYELRKCRLSLADHMPADKAEVIKLATQRLAEFRTELVAKPLDVTALVEAFEADMRAAPLWTRVDGKAALKALEQELRGTVLPRGDLEGLMFKWCRENGAPQPLVDDVKRILDRILTPS